LTDFPVIGFLFNPFLARRENLTDEELREAMFDVLDARLRTVESELIEKVAGWSARRLTTAELFTLCMEFWNGEEVDSERIEPLLDETPAVDRRDLEGSR
jgi:hypothetical protein